MGGNECDAATGDTESAMMDGVGGLLLPVAMPPSSSCEAYEPMVVPNPSYIAVKRYSASEHAYVESGWNFTSRGLSRMDPLYRPNEFIVRLARDDSSSSPSQR
ncbi:MAG: hypothetical protein WC763_06425 [Candidatus Paceibacterota bacterium]|jgi:hypothetical protein